MINALLFKNEEGEIDYRMCFMIYSLPIVSIYVLYNIIKTALSDYNEDQTNVTEEQEGPIEV